MKNIAILISSILATQAFAAPPSYTIERIGLIGNGYTNSSGYSSNEVNNLNSAGQVIGTSSRYNSANTTYYGVDVWRYSGGNTVKIGLSGAGYTSQKGYAENNLFAMNNSGQVVGGSYRYNAANNNDYGQDAWIYNGVNTVKIGLSGTDYTRYDDFSWNAVNGLNNAGYAVGTTQRYIGANYNASGSDAWLYNGTNTVRIGFTGVGYTSQNGMAESYANRLNNLGQVAGYSRIYNASNNIDYGTAAWFYNGGNTQRIGLTGVGYTRQDGTAVSFVSDMNNNGYVVGLSQRGNAANNNNYGQDVWLYNGSNTSKIGLTGAGFTSSTGMANSQVSFLNNAGQAAGHSIRYNGASYPDYGAAAWLYDGTTNTQIGLTGVGYTNQAGQANSYISGLNDAGQVAGRSVRYKSSDNNNYGNDIWFYDGNTSVKIGLSGSTYTSSTGKTESTFTALNNIGQVAGYTKRFNGTNDSWGQSAWLYDSSLGQTFDLTFDSNSSGSAESQIMYLGDDGVALGYYSDFNNQTQQFIGQRAFYFKANEGLFDLGTLVTDLSLDGWIALGNAIKGNGIGNIIGTGYFSGQSIYTSAYILKPSEVPVPATAWLMGSGLIGLAGIARRKK